MVEFTDKPCAGGEPVDLPAVPAPPPKAAPGRLVIIDKSTNTRQRINANQQRKIRGSIRKLGNLNAKLRLRIREIRQRKESELLSVPLGSPDSYSQMTTINIYWNEKIQMLERQYDRNLDEINRLRNIASD